MPTQAETLSKYQDEVRRSRRWRKDNGYDQLWNDLIDFYSESSKGVQRQLNHDEDQVSVNIAFSTINVIYPSISVNQPKVEVQANNPAEEDKAVFVEAVLDYHWKHGDFQIPFRRAAKDYLVIGHGWTKVGWSFVEEDQEVEPELAEQEFQDKVDVVNDIAFSNPDRASELPSDEEIAASVERAAPVVVEDQPFIERISPFDMFVDPEATHDSNIRWITQRIVMPMEDLQADDNFEKKARRELEGAGSANIDPSQDPRETGDTKRRDTVEVFEFYDLVAGTVCKFATDAEHFLVKPQRIPFAFGHPYEMVRNYDVPDVFYPIGDLEMIAPLQMELNKVRTEQANYTAKYARKFLYRTGAFTQSEAAKLVEKRDGVVIAVEDDTRSLNDIVSELQINNLDPNLFNTSQQIISDVQEVSGVSEFARGSSSGARKTATEASLIQDGLNARSADKLTTIEGFVTRIARKVLQLSQQFTTGGKIARIFGPDGTAEFLQYERQDILGEFDFTTEAGSTRPNNETFRRQQAIALSQILAPFMELGIVDPRALVKHILQEGFSVRNVDKFMLQQQQQVPADPQQQVLPGGNGGPGVDANQPNAAERREITEGPQNLQQELAALGGINA